MELPRGFHRNLPRTKDPSDPARRDYIVWEQGRLFELWRLWNSTIVKARPDARYIANSGGGALSGLDMKVGGEMAPTLFADRQCRSGVMAPWANGKGLLFCRGDGPVPRWLAIAEENHDERNFPVLANGIRREVDPAKALLFFLETLWIMLEQSPRHPGFDIRSYMDDDLSSFIPFIPFDVEGRPEQQ